MVEIKKYGLRGMYVCVGPCLQGFLYWKCSVLEKSVVIRGKLLIENVIGEPW